MTLNNLAEMGDNEKDTWYSSNMFIILCMLIYT